MKKQAALGDFGRFDAEHGGDRPKRRKANSDFGEAAGAFWPLAAVHL
jgi:hypothetical protein